MHADLPRKIICRAFREAGRIVVAAEYGIEVREVAVVSIGNRPAGTCLVSLDQAVAQVECPGEISDLVDRYIMVRLAGTITEMVRAAYRWKTKQHVVCWRRWRKRWKRQFVHAGDTDLDTAFAIALGWFGREAKSELETRLDELWEDTESLIRQGNNWAKIETLAGELLRADAMTGSQAI